MSANKKLKSGTVTTNDGVQLHYCEAGEGAPIVLLHGIAENTEHFKYQIEGLSDRYRVIAIDQRGHGESEAPDHGFKISRLAADLHDVLKALDLSRVTLLGHSMGAAVICSYLELFGDKHIEKIIFVEHVAFLTTNPAWSQAELEAAGAHFTSQEVIEIANMLGGPNFEALIRGFLDAAFVDDPAAKEWFMQACLKTSRLHIGGLMYDLLHHDARAIIPRIKLPTLIFAGRVSLHPWKAQVWIHEQIPGSQLEIFEANDGGNHFLLFENPERFNRIVANFMG
jgi:non-heme chloroperoxidase